ncbi:HK97 gp10 family phage protein [Paenibacillus sp. D2_2]|uniref:HK97 gp10 family phage protein n=1 Tax=Paenibacillus sp. D2_2 TaxID=3073092 RepID=UPI002814A569|nr:HK97 gp10 family phage protein [Paenibacillus sp. D2_2]WMT42847.1 HK97 gp10 family phage protein [Paenibacillus sp. D2_2]
MADFRIDGMKELESMFKQLEKVPQTVATKAARAGATIPLKAAREDAPEDDGDLKKGIILKRERKVKVGKAVYGVMMDPAKNDIFVKTSADGKRSYYPASMEYGFLTVDGGYVPGYHFMRNALEDNKVAVEKKVLDTAKVAVEKILKG